MLEEAIMLFGNREPQLTTERAILCPDVYAYALITNHVHLLLSADRTKFAGELMKVLGQRYVQYVNRTYQRSGTLWEGRFRFCSIQEETYLACVSAL
ncbi:transposase [Nitrosomonas communis]|uniref:transposase n=1 Tax=Nitrosomonas communis TaxID=44574 RepID=UPI0026F33B87|nr:transposase [Nitrosomonas communis]MCO6427684.1 transposase [Nitrosomonas communis]